jgi:cell wall-associated NlpC family hydrolase
LSFLSRVSATQNTADNFTQIEEGQWVYTKHISPLDGAYDLADIASLYIGTPYRFGGRSMFGIDCSGLIQNCLIAKSFSDIPRDTKDQEDSFGKPVKKQDLQRNDIVFFKGHVGIMLNKTKIINATERHMITLIEDLKDLEKIYKGITHIARV